MKGEKVDREIKLKYTRDDFDEAELVKLILATIKSAGIEGAIEVNGIRYGSVIIEIALGKEDADRLKNAFESGALAGLGVESIAEAERKEPTPEDVATRKLADLGNQSVAIQGVHDAKTLKNPNKVVTNTLDLDKIIRLHSMWREGRKGGQCANLSRAEWH
jgi:hypothetical protein